MGCWNKTCGLSKLHIYSGDPVYVFVIEQNLTHERCYTTAFWEPVLAPFEAKYNDYGGGEEESGPWLPYIMDAVKANLVEMEVGENQYHDIAVKAEGFDAEQFWESVHEGRLMTEDRKGRQRHVDFVMMRKDIVDDMLANYEFESYVGDGKGNRETEHGNNYLYYKFNDILSDVPELLDKLTEALTVESDDVKDLLDKGAPMSPEKRRNMVALLAAHQLYDGLGSVFEHRSTNKASWFLRREHSGYSRLLDTTAVISGLLVEGNRDAANELLVELLRGRVIESLLDSVRGVWMPGGHEGSQASEHTGYRALTAAINRALDEEKHRWDE